MSSSYFQCPECRGFVSEDQDECNSCGADISRILKVSVEKNATPRCPDCGSFVSKQYDQCYSCGESLWQENPEEEGQDLESRVQFLEEQFETLQEENQALREQNEALQEENERIRAEHQDLQETLKEHAQCLYEQDERFRDFVGVICEDFSFGDRVSTVLDFWGVEHEQRDRYRTLVGGIGPSWVEYEKRWEWRPKMHGIQKVTVPEEGRSMQRIYNNVSSSRVNRRLPIDPIYEVDLEEERKEDRAWRRV